MAFCPFLCNTSCRFELFIVCDLVTLTSVRFTCFILSHCPPYSGKYPDKALKDPRYRVQRHEHVCLLLPSVRRFSVCCRSPCVCSVSVFIGMGGLCALNSSVSSPCTAIMIWFSFLHDSHEDHTFVRSAGIQFDEAVS